MTRILGVCAGLWAVVVMFLALPLRAETVTVFAAASLRDALTEITTDWQAQTGHRVRVSSAGSSALARQIQAGAPADLFVSANEAWMQAVISDGVVEAASLRVIAGNRLVLIGAAELAPVELNTPGALAKRLDGGRLAMALISAVPAGIYGAQALRSTGQWDTVQAQVAQTDNVRAALALVARGAAPLGVVYATDARAAPRVDVVAQFPRGSHDPIRYPAALVGDAPTPAARALLMALTAPAAQAIFAAHGFTAPPDAG